MTSNESILAEYRSIRSEIEQLNGQIFLVFTGSLTANVTIMGWFFTQEKRNPYILTIGIAILLLGSLLLLNRNRLAHRLAIFQKYFIESRITDICWSRVYFEYRYRTDPWSTARNPPHITRLFRWIFWILGERLADATSWILFWIGAINGAILFVWTRKYFSLNLGCLRVWNIVVAPQTIPIPDCLQVWNITAAFAILAVQGSFTWAMPKYEDIDNVMYNLAIENVPDAARVHSPFERNKKNELIHLSYWLDMDDRTLVMVITKGIGANLTNDEKRAHLIDIKREHLIEQVCPPEILPPEK
jgi:hypothetical protein